MLVSVVVPIFNAEKTIVACIGSIIDKWGKNDYEIIVVDGLSQDNSLELVKSFPQYDQKINLISEKDNGIYDAMNKGVNSACATYTMFLGADDELLVEWDELSALLTDKNTIYYGNVQFNDSDKTIYDGEFDTMSLIERNICHQAILYPTHILQNNRYDLRYRLLGDYELNIRLWNKHKWAYVDTTIAMYNIDGLSSQIKDDAFKKDFLRIIYINLGLKYFFFKILITLKRKFRN